MKVLCGVLILVVLVSGSGCADLITDIQWGLTEGSRPFPISVTFISETNNYGIQCFQTGMYVNGEIIDMTPRAVTSGVSGGPSGTPRYRNLAEDFSTGLAGKASSYWTGRFVWILRATDGVGGTLETHEQPFVVVSAAGVVTPGDPDYPDPNSGPAHTPGFWESLFVPSEEMVQNLFDEWEEMKTLSPIGIIEDFQEALANPADGFGYTDENDRRQVYFGTMHLMNNRYAIPLRFDVTPVYPTLQWLRKLMGASLWIMFAIHVFKRYGRVVA